MHSRRVYDAQICSEGPVPLTNSFPLTKRNKHDGHAKKTNGLSRDAQDFLNRKYILFFRHFGTSLHINISIIICVGRSLKEIVDAV